MNPTTVGKDGVDRPWVRLPRPKRDPLARFREKYVVDPTGCFLWQDSLNPGGYGRFNVGYERMYAHAFACDVVGKYCPQGMHHDHLCRVRHCVNPDHIEIVLPRINYLRGISPPAQHARKTTCRNGHPFDLIRIKADGPMRVCTICERETRLRRYAATHPKAPAVFVVPGEEPWHGRPSGYQNYKCRCDRCRKANTDYMREYWRGRGRPERRRADPAAKGAHPVSPLASSVQGYAPGAYLQVGALA